MRRELEDDAGRFLADALAELELLAGPGEAAEPGPRGPQPAQSWLDFRHARARFLQRLARDSAARRGSR
jgi:hypothetical protein